MLASKLCVGLEPRQIHVNALAGVHFRAMSAPGPSGARPEHLREFVVVRDRRIASRLTRAIAKLVDVASIGQLCAEGRWILDSRLVYLKKKGSITPRPIRVGELWRRVVAKRMIEINRKSIQDMCFNARQFGVAVPGGADALIHFRVELEKVLHLSAKAMAVIDVDLKNAFPSFEWDSIRQAVLKHCPKLLAWTEWCHVKAALVHLPSGAKLCVDRGAEQGDPLGSVYCALVLADALEIVRERLRAKGVDIFDLWYMDDGQIICDALHVDEVLRTLDLILTEIGAMRGFGTDAKSMVRILGEPRALQAVDGQWCSQYVTDSTKAIPASGGHILGIDFEGSAQITLQFEEVIEAVEALHANLAQVEDVATEIVLVRACADVCKVTHLLRAGGLGVEIRALEKYDNLLQRSLERIMGGPIGDAAVI